MRTSSGSGAAVATPLAHPAAASPPFPHPDRLGPLLGLARLYQRWGLQSASPAQPASSRAFRGWPRWRRCCAACPTAAAVPEYLPARGKARGRVARAHGVRAAPPLRRRQPRHGAAAVAGRAGTSWRRAGRDAAARSSCTPATPRRSRRGAGAGGGDAGGRRLGRHQRGRLWLGACATTVTGCPTSPAARLAGRVRDVTEVLVDAPLPLGRVAADGRLSRRLSSGARPEGARASRARCSGASPA